MSLTDSVRTTGPHPEAAPAPSAAPAGRWARLAPLALVLLPTALYAVLGWTHRWTSDDAFINFRVVDHLVHGDGPVFNAGERVEAFTSAVWIAIVSAGSVVFGQSYVEWFAAVLGLLLAAGGLAAASLGAWFLIGDRARSGALALPLGALAFAVLPPAWDFATSGLETGLSFAWLGGCFLAAVLLHRREGRGWRRVSIARGWDGLAVVAGLGVLVRPDFAIFSAGFLILAILLPGRPTAGTVLRRVALAAALPLLYELFRMAYFATLVPNTALAKEAGQTDWSRGWSYLWDALEPYALLFPLLALSAWSLGAALEADPSERRGVGLLRGVPVAMGVVHLLYIAAVGGDFMHGRMALPGILCILMPVAVVPVRRRAMDGALVAGVAGWALVCAAGLRTEYSGTSDFTKTGIADERAWYVRWSGRQHPVTLDAYRKSPWGAWGVLLGLRSHLGERTVTFFAPDIRRDVPALAARPGTPRLLTASGHVGMMGYAAGREVDVVDLAGLGDPIASRQRLVRRSRAGHEKALPEEWVIARFAEPSRLPRAYSTHGWVVAARAALGCGDVPQLLDAVREPLTVERALDNIGFAFASTGLRFDPEPPIARRELCG